MDQRQRSGNRPAHGRGGPIGISRHMLDGILSPMRIAIAIGIWTKIPILLLAAIWMGWASPVWADSPRYRSTNGFVTLEFDRSLGAPLGTEPLLGQFVNQTPGEHWVGTLQLEPVHTVGSDGLTSMHGRFRDFSPGTEPLVVCTGEVEVQLAGPIADRAAAPAPEPMTEPTTEPTTEPPPAPSALAVAFKITGGQHCQAMLGDAYTVNFAALDPPLP
jgi:hypothetical protein